MFVVIEKLGKVIYEDEIDKDRVVLGRGSSCDIRIKEDCISREHLLLERDEERLNLKLLASNNWVILDGKKVLTSESYPFFEFNTVMLPGDMEVRITFEKKEETESENSFTVEPKIRERSQINSPRAAREKNSKLNRIEASDILFGLMGASVVVFWAYYLSTSQIPFMN
ncbi:MAG: FHA domain-containing protein [Bacteriovoracaceae bacterium]|nr:FHA domain-containing protein [Bacteriovoracaceae bacterium]